MDDHFNTKFNEIFVDGDFEERPKLRKVPQLNQEEIRLARNINDGPFIEELKGKSDES